MKPVRHAISVLSAPFPGRRLALTVTMTSALALLSACASDPKTAAGEQVKALRYDAATQQEGGPDDLTVSSGKSQDFIAAAAYWGERHAKNPGDVEAALRYSRALRLIGSVPQALEVMQRMQTGHGDDPRVIAETGKVLTANGKPGIALSYLDRAETLTPNDWTVLSAGGVARDQLGRYTEAQAKYLAALDLAPDNPSILSNLGLSYALSGALDEAETYLRRAVANPAASATARQNLAIVMGLKGNFEEASRLAEADLPPSVAANNIAYLREMLTQPALWKQMESLDGKGTKAALAAHSQADDMATGSISR